MTDPVPAAVHHAHDRQRLSLVVDGWEAELAYRLQETGAPGAGAVMVIEHTGVPEAIGGRGLAGRLVQAAFELARSRGWKVVPACSYARVWATRHPEVGDLLAP